MDKQEIVKRKEARQILACWLVSSKGTEEQLGYIEGWFDKNDEKAFRMAIEALNGRPKGEWIDREQCQVDEDAYDVAICSNCKAEITLEYPNDNYCPNCGSYNGGDKE